MAEDEELERSALSRGRVRGGEVGPREGGWFEAVLGDCTVGAAEPPSDFQPYLEEFRYLAELFEKKMNSVAVSINRAVLLLL